tara:strand:- start:14 stop:310 length:297 start_codon:yes stop_codon:yes gene_type:complete
MAITKTTDNDKIEIVNHWGIQIRTATVLKEDGNELSRTFHRRTLTPGELKGGTGSDKQDLVNTDISGESAEIQAICNAVWTDAVKEDYRQHLIEIHPV